MAGLELDENLPFQQRFRHLQRAGAVLAFAFLLAALLGIFGTGPLAHATASAPAGMKVDYDRFVRSAASTSLTIALPQGQGKTNIAVGDRNYLDDVQIAQVSPDPDSVTALPDRTVYTIDQQPPTEIEITLTPVKMGVRHATVYGPQGQVVHFTQIVYP